jgi:hypothetical protein
VEEKQHEALKKEMADWLYRAMDPSTPTTKGGETVRTVDYTQDGVTYVAPTLRMIDGKLKRYSTDDAIDEAIKRGDGMRVPDGMSGTEFSQALSKRIGKARGRSAQSSAEKAR